MRRTSAVLVLSAMLALGAAPSRAAAHQLPQQFRRQRMVAPAMAVYEWHNAGDLSAAAVRRRLCFLRASGFRTVYLEVGRYLDAAELPPEDPNREEGLAAVRRQIRRFVASAAGFGLSVQALGGGPTWTGELRYLGQELVDLVADYNLRVRARDRLAGVQLDLEPYTLPGWLDQDVVDEHLVEYLVSFQGIVDTYRARLAEPANRRLQLGLAIPFWLDARGDAPGPVEFNEVTKPAAHHVIDLVADLPRAYLVVMSYRNFTRTADGSIAHARDEFRYAAAVGASSGLVVGQRYGPPGPGEEHTSFHGQPRWVFRRAAAAIFLAFRRYPQFRGLSLDDVDAYMAAAP